MAARSKHLSHTEQLSVAFGAPFNDTPGKAQPLSKEALDEAEGSTPASSTEGPVYLTGWRLHGITFGCILAVFLVTLEVSVVSTAIIAITSELQSYDQSAWIVTAFLTSYTGFLIISAKLSDVFSYKSVYLVNLVIFVAFSGACGGAQTMQQLIAFRTLQGVGAAGVYSNTILIIYRLVPPETLPTYGAIITFVLLISDVLGPVIGGGLSGKVSMWRWVFYLNLPAGAVALLAIQVSMPARFPLLTAAASETADDSPSSKRVGLAKVDYFGAMLLVGGTALLLVGLFQGSTASTWSSAATIACMTAAGISFILFFAWEYRLTYGSCRADPIFPWRFVHNRPWMGMLLTTFIVGFPFNVIIINLPQSFQLTQELSPLQAGVRLLPYLIGASLSAILTSISCSKLKIPFVSVLLAEAVIQTAVLGALITTTNSLDFPAVGYFIVLMAGFGVGGVVNMLAIATPVVVESQDLAVATGAVAQFRFLGGAIGLSIASAISNGYLRSKLVGILSEADVTALLRDANVVHTFTPEAKLAVQSAFVNIYRQLYIVIACLSGVQIVGALMVWKKEGKQLRPA